MSARGCNVKNTVMFCYSALFRALLSGLSLELDYLEAIGWGRGEAVCKLFFGEMWLSEAAGSHNDFQRASSEGPAC